MKNKPHSRPKDEKGGSKRPVKEFSKVLGISGPGGHKRRLWVQPKDKSLARKTFLKIRDAKARSQFSKLQKKAGEAAAPSLDSLLPIASADDNEAFLERLLDPFAKPETRESRLPIGSTTVAGKAKHGRSKACEDDSDALGASFSTSQNATGTQLSGPAGSNTKARASQEGEKGDMGSLTGSFEATTGASGMASKGYMPFLKAQKVFQAKQREKKALQIERQAEIEKEMKRKREKKRFDKVAQKKLQARTKKGQLVMGNVVDVLLLKMQKNSCK